MQVKKLANGQYEVTHENLKLVQTVFPVKINDCSIVETEGETLCSSADERFVPLFRALHNFKCENE